MLWFVGANDTLLVHSTLSRLLLPTHITRPTLFSFLHSSYLTLTPPTSRVRSGVRAPLLTIPPEAWGASVSGPLRALAFNPTHREQVATARGDQVSVWLLPAALVRKTAGDARVAGALERGEVPAGVLRAGAVA